MKLHTDCFGCMLFARGYWNEVNAETIRLIDEVAKNAISQAVKKGVPVDKIRESVDPKYWPYIDESVALD